MKHAVFAIYHLIEGFTFSIELRAINQLIPAVKLRIWWKEQEGKF